MCIRSSVFILAAVLFPTILHGQLYISEVVADNDGSLQDKAQSSPDWIEIHNAGEEPVNLEGYRLSDDPDDLDLWRFPNVTITERGFLTVFATGGDSPVEGELHAGFKLSRKGEFLALSGPRGQRHHVIEPKFARVLAGHSFGFAFENGRLLPRQSGRMAPTPGMPNGPVLSKGTVADTKFSVDRGFFDQPFELSVSSATPEVQIRYTLDGSLPTTEHGVLYERPIRISSTAIVRAVAYRRGYDASNVDTHTYLFPESVLRQTDDTVRQWQNAVDWKLGRRQTLHLRMHSPDAIGATSEQVLAALKSLPSLSIVTHPSQLFEERRGIYVNARNRGRQWERPVSLELISPRPGEEEAQFQIDAGLRIRGGFSRSGGNPKHALRLYFRSEYGSGKLRFPLFGDEGTDTFDDIDLRAPQNYSWSFFGYTDDKSQNTFLRDVFSRDCQRAMGQPYTRSRYYHLYINGLYWGIYQTQEHAEASYASQYFGGNKEDYDVVKSNGIEVEATDGDLDRWRSLWEMANEIARLQGREQMDLYHRAQGLLPDGQRSADLPIYLDVGNLIDYMIVIFFTGNFDAPAPDWGPGRDVTRNWFGIGDRNGERGFQYFVHDAEHALGVRGLLKRDRTQLVTSGRRFEHSNPQWLHQQLLAVEAYRTAFARRAHEAIWNDGPLSVEACLARLEKWEKMLEPAIVAESARWGGGTPYTKAHWEKAVEKLKSYLRRRHAIVLQQLQGTQRYRGGQAGGQTMPAPLYPRLTAPIPHGGEDGERFAMRFEIPSGVIYYTTDGSDPRAADGKPAAVATALAGTIVRSQLLLPSDAPIQAWVAKNASFDEDWQKPQFSAPGWVAGKPGVGYDRRQDYKPLIRLDVEQEIGGRYLGVYTRSEFEVKDPEVFKGLIFRAKFEDGLVAYLNGEKVVSINVPNETAWNSAATRQHNDIDAVQFRDFEIEQLGALRRGKNVLACHVMNDDTGSSDLLLVPELVGLVQEKGDALSVSLNKPVTVKARTYDQGEWSLLTESKLGR